MELQKSLFGSVLLIASFSAFAGPYWVDERSPEEFAQGHLKGAGNIPLENMESGIGKVAKDKSGDDIKLYCRSGKRFGQALTRLQAMGYKKVTNEGGLEELAKTHPVEK